MVCQSLTDGKLKQGSRGAEEAEGDITNHLLYLLLLPTTYYLLPTIYYLRTDYYSVLYFQLATT